MLGLEAQQRQVFRPDVTLPPNSNATVSWRSAKLKFPQRAATAHVPRPRLTDFSLS
jgi:hypothetical protein